MKIRGQEFRFEHNVLFDVPFGYPGGEKSQKVSYRFESLIVKVIRWDVVQNEGHYEVRSLGKTYHSWATEKRNTYKID